ncbi:putative Oligoendopeptidase F [Vibrio chagasii]|nr:putative Oligoendopeptidase F [Vibrio chagasii]
MTKKQIMAPKWDLSFLYAGYDDPKYIADVASLRHTLLQIDDLVESFKASNGKVKVDIARRYLALCDERNQLGSSLCYYSYLSSDCDVNNQEFKKELDKVERMYVELGNGASYINDWIMKCEESDFEELFNTDDEDIKARRFSLLRSRTYSTGDLNQPREDILESKLSHAGGLDAWGSLYERLCASMQVNTTPKIDDKPESISLSQVSALLKSNEREVRERVWEDTNKAYHAHRESFAAVLNGLSGWRISSNNHSFGSGEKHYLDSALHKNRISRQTLDTLISTVKKNKSVGQRAATLIAKTIGDEDGLYQPWDMYASYPAASGNHTIYTFDEGIEIIKDAFRSIHPDMADFVDLMVREKRISANVSKNKSTGAYCGTTGSERVSVIFMSYTGTSGDVVTLAHELGHAFHNHILRDIPKNASSYPSTLAETASVFAETVVREALLAKAVTRDEKLAFLFEDVTATESYLLMICARYELEVALHEERLEGYVTPERLIELTESVWSEWYGDSIGTLPSYSWAITRHFSFSSSTFYNFPYVFGMLFSNGIYAASKNTESKDSFYEFYKDLLRNTGTLTCESLAEKYLGVDMEKTDFWQSAINELDSKVDEYSRLLSEE